LPAPPSSLRARALKALARREHTRQELQDKLRPFAEDADELEPLLDDLEKRGWLSEARFVEQLTTVRRRRFGAARILHELREKGVSETALAAVQSRLKDSEVDLREVEYAACNGMLRTLDPHSVFLSPEAFEEMNLSTSGHFGGLGIVISIRDQMLTIMRPMPGTPAGRSGLKRLDRITKINNESTLNMPLDDAVDRLRGKPGSKVTIWVHRDGDGGWANAKPFELVREEINIESVDSRSLAPGIGYVRLKQFQASTADELDQALEALGKKQKLKGLVLDLRDNPGGLLDQAAKVADRFLERGVIVATVGGTEPRDEKIAQRRGTEPPYPIVTIVNASSASASEMNTAGRLMRLPVVTSG